jgi:hypothetical protein
MSDLDQALLERALVDIVNAERTPAPPEDES